MSVILGIYDRRGPIDRRRFAPVLEEFAQGSAARDLALEFGTRTIFAWVRHATEPPGEKIAADEDHAVQLLLGGELFDFEDELARLRQAGRRIRHDHDPAEFLLHSFAEHGPAGLSEVNGAFAFAHYDAKRDELSLGNDAFGLHPLFIYEDSSCCIFSSEYEPILAFSQFTRRLEHDAIAEYFLLTGTLRSQTFLRGIENLPQGSVRTIGPERAKTERYDDLAIAIDRRASLDDFADEAAALLRGAVGARLRYREGADCSLTGGLDTRLILGCMSPEQRAASRFFTIKSPILSESEDDEVIIARELATAYGLEHHVIDSTNPAEAGDVDASFLARSRNLPPTRFKFEGFYGDTMMAAHIFRSRLGRMIEGGVDRSEIGRSLGELFHRSKIPHIRNPADTLAEEMKAISAENRELLFMLHYLTRGFMTTYANGSPNGWVMPYRQISHNRDSIFRDVRLLRFVLTLPMEYLKDRVFYDHLYARHFPELCRFPTNTRNSVVPLRPPVQRMRRKPRYTNTIASYRESEITWEKDLYDRPNVEAMLADEAHPLVPALVDFESWYRGRGRIDDD